MIGTIMIKHFSAIVRSHPTIRYHASIPLCMAPRPVSKQTLGFQLQSTHKTPTWLALSFFLRHHLLLVVANTTTTPPYIIIVSTHDHYIRRHPWILYCHHCLSILCEGEKKSPTFPRFFLNIVKQKCQYVYAIQNKMAFFFFRSVIIIITTTTPRRSKVK